MGCEQGHLDKVWLRGGGGGYQWRRHLKPGMGNKHNDPACLRRPERRSHLTPLPVIAEGKARRRAGDMNGKVYTQNESMFR